MWTTLIFAGTGGLFVLCLLHLLWSLRWVQRLPALTELAGFPGSVEERLPKCSVVIAGRDEEARIEQTLRRLMVQRGVELEVIVVDDRSTDCTPEILRRLAAEDARIRVQRVDVLPAGWLGKCHACHVGASTATGDWILFTDADCWLKPDLLERALRLAERDEADHITLMASVTAGTIGLKAWQLMFLISLTDWVAGVNRDRPKSYVGMGAFNLVRTSAYRQCGGYEALRLTVLDDVRLGLLLRRAGKRTRAFLGGDDVECHWGTTVWHTVKILEKNYFATLDYRTWMVVAGTLFVAAVMGVCLLGLFSGTEAGLFAAVGPLWFIVPALVLAKRVGFPWLSAVCAPLILPLLYYTAIHSTVVTLRQGGVRWRDTFYSLEELRKGGVR